MLVEALTSEKQKRFMLVSLGPLLLLLGTARSLLLLLAFTSVQTVLIGDYYKIKSLP